ncbi:MAG: RNA methyltransferase [Candidatus Eremiobacteraeota bacterium]|nr:RNA methyltransferase [Candidatus Eremiobacteraeota bacterium]
MAAPLGRHAQRLRAAAALRSVKGRREQRRFRFEGATLLGEAAAAGFPILELYATQAAYESTPLLRRLEDDGTPLFIADEGALAAISDVTTPTGIVAVGPIRLTPPGALFTLGTPILMLADLNDPANAGTLLRAADAFGAPGILFGSHGVDPYHPKVVRGSMGALFRLAVSVADATEARHGASLAKVRMVGLAAGGPDLREETWQGPVALVVGNERRGLGEWGDLCERVLAIAMPGRAESLSAAVAGSIALYEASRNSVRT